MRDPELSLDEIADQVVTILVTSFGFPETEARHRINLWKAQQHQLEGQTLEGILPSVAPEERAQRLLAWVLRGDQVERDLRDGARKLGFKLTE